MCVAEFVTYSCGHCSVPVLRTCPLTTVSHVYQHCPQPATRPTEVSWFCAACAACAREIHTRHTDIVEFEHRWMHIRGACSCPVEFPENLGPRLVGPREPCPSQSDEGLRLQTEGDPSSDLAGVKCEDDASVDAGVATIPQSNEAHDVKVKTEPKSDSDYGGIPMLQTANDARAKTEEDATTDAKDVIGKSKKPRHRAGKKHRRRKPAKHPEAETPTTVTTTTIGGNSSKFNPQGVPIMKVYNAPDGTIASASVRIPSMYGVEWAADHAERHTNGECTCNVSFESYGPHSAVHDMPQADFLAAVSDPNRVDPADRESDAMDPFPTPQVKEENVLQANDETVSQAHEGNSGVTTAAKPDALEGPSTQNASSSSPEPRGSKSIFSGNTILGRPPPRNNRLVPRTQGTPVTYGDENGLHFSFIGPNDTPFEPGACDIPSPARHASVLIPLSGIGARCCNSVQGAQPINSAGRGVNHSGRKGLNPRAQYFQPNSRWGSISRDLWVPRNTAAQSAPSYNRNGQDTYRPAPPAQQSMSEYPHGNGGRFTHPDCYGANGNQQDPNQRTPYSMSQHPQSNGSQLMPPPHHGANNGSQNRTPAPIHDSSSDEEDVYGVSPPRAPRTSATRPTNGTPNITQVPPLHTRRQQPSDCPGPARPAGLYNSHDPSTASHASTLGGWWFLPTCEDPPGLQQHPHPAQGPTMYTSASEDPTRYAEARIAPRVALPMAAGPENPGHRHARDWAHCALNYRNLSNQGGVGDAGPMDSGGSGDDEAQDPEDVDWKQRIVSGLVRYRTGARRRSKTV